MLNGDAFALFDDKLLAVARLVHKYFPNIQTLASYASIRNITDKSDEDLRRLKEAGFNDLYTGRESGWDQALKQMRKGFVIGDSYRELERLRAAGIRYAALVMPGIGGKNNSETNARETAKLLNARKPFMILATRAVMPGTPLEKMRDFGEYAELTEREIVEEELALPDAHDMDDNCYFFGSHSYNTVPVSGFFADKDKIMAYLEFIP